MHHIIRLIEVKTIDSLRIWEFNSFTMNTPEGNHELRERDPSENPDGSYNPAVAARHIIELQERARRQEAGDGDIAAGAATESDDHLPEAS